MPPTRPHLLAIGAQHLLTKRVRPRHAPTLLAGYTLALRQLAVTASPHPTLILLDLDAEEPGLSIAA